ncbi:hypothetical protein GCM10027360_55890 [Amycolatopsis echigonensis]
MVEGDVDDRVGLGGADAQGFRVGEIAAEHAGARVGDLLSCGVGAGQAQHFVSGGGEFGDEQGADSAAGSGDEDLHVEPP